MGTYAGGSLSLIKGKVGNVTSYTTKTGYSVVRQIGLRKAAFTVSELANQSGTGLITKFLKSVLPVIRTGFQVIPAGKHWTAYNHASSVLKLTALKGSYPNKEIDYEKVLFSKGSIPGPKNVTVKLENGQLNFSWEADLKADGAGTNDRVMIVAYFPETMQSLYILSGAKRTEQQEFLPLPGFTQHTTIETYISFVNDNRNNVSDSVYSGQIFIDVSLITEEKLPQLTNNQDTAVKVLPRVKKPGRNMRYARKRKKVVISEQNLRIKLISDNQRLLTEAINLGFAAAKEKGSAYSRATKYNLKHAIRGQYPDLQVDFSKFRISRGSREGIWAGKLRFEPDSWIQLDWEIPETCDLKEIGNDRAVIAVYQPDSYLLYSLTFERFNTIRKALSHRVRLNNEGDCGFVHVWMFFISPDGKEISESHYFGSGIINDQPA